MSLDTIEMKNLKLKLFELLDNESPNIALGAAQFLVQLSQTPSVGWQTETLETMKEQVVIMKEELELHKKGLEDKA